MSNIIICAMFVGRGKPWSVFVLQWFVTLGLCAFYFMQKWMETPQNSSKVFDTSSGIITQTLSSDLKLLDKNTLTGFIRIGILCNLQIICKWKHSCCCFVTNRQLASYTKVTVSYTYLLSAMTTNHQGRLCLGADKVSCTMNLQIGHLLNAEC